MTKKWSTYQYRPANLYSPKYDLFLSVEYIEAEHDRILEFITSHRNDGVYISIDSSAQIYRKVPPNESGSLFTFKDKEIASLFRLAFDARKIIV